MRVHFNVALLLYLRASVPFSILTLYGPKMMPFVCLCVWDINSSTLVTQIYPLHKSTLSPCQYFIFLYSTVLFPFLLCTHIYILLSPAISEIHFKLHIFNVLWVGLFLDCLVVNIYVNRTLPSPFHLEYLLHFKVPFTGRILKIYCYSDSSW